MSKTADHNQIVVEADGEKSRLPATVAGAPIKSTT